MKEQISRASWVRKRLLLCLCAFLLGMSSATFLMIKMDVQIYPENKILGVSIAPHVTKQTPLIAISPAYHPIKLHDVVSVRTTYNGKPTTSGISYVKRVIGMPNETIRLQEHEIFVDGVKLDDPFGEYSRASFDNLEVRLENNEYFLMGDNRSNSQDSRHFGPFLYENINWVAIHIFSPKRD